MVGHRETDNTGDEGIDLAAIVREAAAGYSNITVVDMADLGQHPPQIRHGGHLMAQAVAAVELVQIFHEKATYHLAVAVATAYQQAEGVDDEGGLDLDLDSVAAHSADDPDITEPWSRAKPGARRDLLASLAQLLAQTRRRHGVAAQDVAQMIGNRWPGGGHLWQLAEQQLDDAVKAGRDWEHEAMLPDGPHLPALETSPVSAQAEAVVTHPGNDDRTVLGNAAVLLAVATILQTNATDNWQGLLNRLG